MVTNFNDQNTVLKEDMEQMMPIIYGELRELFFRNVHKKLPQFIDCKALKIMLLDETEPKTLGKFSIDQVIAEIDIEKIEALMDKIRRDNRCNARWLKEAVEILSEIIKCCDCGEFEGRNKVFEDMLRKLCFFLEKAKEEATRAFNNDDCKKIIEEIIKEIEKAIYVLKNREIKIDILGEFSAKDNQITLYTKTNDKHKGSSTLRNRMLATLAHELFHAMHCSVIGKNKWIKKPGDAKEKVDARDTVIESLARWAEYCWCKHHDEDDFKYLAREMKKGWGIRDFPSDHYAGAKVFDNEGVIDLDIEVLNDSLKSWKRAYKKMESHRNDKVSKGSIDEEVKELYHKLIDEHLIYNLCLNEWAILHLHDATMSERYNVIVSELIQYELEQKGFAVASLPCKDNYFKRDNEKSGWGKSALLLIINGELIPTKCFIEALDSVESKYVNISSFFIRAVSKLNELDVVYFKAKDANKVKVVSWDNRYGGYNENRIFCTIEYILRELESQRPNYKP